MAAEATLKLSITDVEEFQQLLAEVIVHVRHIRQDDPAYQNLEQALRELGIDANTKS